MPAQDFSWRPFKSAFLARKARPETNPTSPDHMEEACNWYSLKPKEGFLTFSIVLIGTYIFVISISIVFSLYWNWSEKIILEFHAFSAMFNQVLFPSFFHPFWSSKCNSKVWKMNWLGNYFTDTSPSRSSVYLLHFCTSYIFIHIIIYNIASSMSWMKYNG